MLAGRFRARHAAIFTLLALLRRYAYAAALIAADCFAFICRGHAYLLACHAAADAIE